MLPLLILPYSNTSLKTTFKHSVVWTLFLEFSRGFCDVPRWLFGRATSYRAVSKKWWIACCDLTPAGNEVLQQLLTPSPSPQWDGRRITKVKVRKLKGCDEDGFMGKSKATYTRKAKQRINSSLSQDSRAPSHITLTWEDKTLSLQMPPLFLLLL